MSGLFFNVVLTITCFEMRHTGESEDQLCKRFVVVRLLVSGLTFGFVTPANIGMNGGVGSSISRCAWRE